jgi:DNA-binding MarR family transcriptional regulator
MMRNELKTSFLKAMMRFRKMGMQVPPGENIRIGELFVLGRISEQGVNMTEIQNNLFMTKSAVSQILSDLEGRRLIRREIDPSDRRKIKVTLTDDGKKFLQRQRQYADDVLELTITRFGEENMNELLRLLNKLTDVAEEIKQEGEKPVNDYLKGDKPLD